MQIAAFEHCAVVCLSDALVSRYRRTEKNMRAAGYFFPNILALWVHP